MSKIDKVKEATGKLIELFESGNIPLAIAATTIRAKSGFEIPSDKWSLGKSARILSISMER